MLKFDYSMAEGFYNVMDYEIQIKKAREEQIKLYDGKGAGSDFIGWLDLPLKFPEKELERINETAAAVKEIAEVMIVIGIGGSYLGARSAIEALKGDFAFYSQRNQDGHPHILFAGNNISSGYLSALIEIIKEKEVVLNVVSKSGTTLEPAIAFRALRKVMEDKYGRDNLRERIICTTDKGKGLLKEIADKEGYPTFEIADDVGGRYSVLTAVGLLPMAVAGIDIHEIMAGAREIKEKCKTSAANVNPACLYAAMRNLLYENGKSIEIMATYEPSFKYITEWWQQLFGESEGKEGKGIYPAGLTFSTDLHSMGQYIQEGRRDIFLTTLWAEKPLENFTIPESSYPDGLEFLQGKEMHYVNENACRGTRKAHTEGGVPNLMVSVPRMTPFYYGQLVYFFQEACAVSGYMSGINPFDQPGVEAYKKNMYALLGK